LVNDQMGLPLWGFLHALRKLQVGKRVRYWPRVQFEGR